MRTLLFGLDQTRRHYAKVLREKSSLFYERFDLDMLEKRPLVRNLVDNAFQRLFPEKVDHLLDIGCGTCFYFPLLARHANKITGIDLCIPMLEQAKQMIEEKGLTNCEVRESSAVDLPIEDNSVDVVHSWDFLHHVHDVSKSIDEIVRVLKPRGRYIALEPNIINPSILWYHLRRRSEWRIFSQNQITIPRKLRRHFDVKTRYDNTIISFLNKRTQPIWKFVDTLTKVPVFHLLSFRYILDCRLKDGVV